MTIPKLQILGESVVLDTVIALRILHRLIRPFDQYRAYQLGVIDADGHVLVPPTKRTPEQQASLTRLDILTINLKKLLAKLPYGKSRLASIAAALYLVRESSEKDLAHFVPWFRKVMSNPTALSEVYFASIILSEDNAVGDGTALSIDEPVIQPYKLRKKKKES